MRQVEDMQIYQWGFQKQTQATATLVTSFVTNEVTDDNADSLPQKEGLVQPIQEESTVWEEEVPKVPYFVVYSMSPSRCLSIQYDYFI